MMYMFKKNWPITTTSMHTTRSSHIRRNTYYPLCIPFFFSSFFLVRWFVLKVFLQGSSTDFLTRPQVRLDRLAVWLVNGQLPYLTKWKVNRWLWSYSSAFMRGQPEGVQLCSISSCPGWDSEKRINMSWQQLMKSERGPQLRLLGRFWFSRSKCWQLRLPPTRSNLDGKEDASQMECPRRRNITYKETGEIWFMTVRVMRFLPGMSRYFSS